MMSLAFLDDHMIPWKIPALLLALVLLACLSFALIEAPGEWQGPEMPPCVPERDHLVVC